MANVEQEDKEKIHSRTFQKFSYIFYIPVDAMFANNWPKQELGREQNIGQIGRALYTTE